MAWADRLVGGSHRNLPARPVNVADSHLGLPRLTVDLLSACHPSQIQVGLDGATHPLSPDPVDGLAWWSVSLVLPIWLDELDEDHPAYLPVDEPQDHVAAAATLAVADVATLRNRPAGGGGDRPVERLIGAARQCTPQAVDGRVVLVTDVVGHVDGWPFAAALVVEAVHAVAGDAIAAVLDATALPGPAGMWREAGFIAGPDALQAKPAGPAARAGRQALFGALHQRLEQARDGRRNDPLR